MPTYLAAIDLTGNELRNVLAQLLATDPASPVEGRIWYDTGNHVLKYRTNSTTVALAAGSDVPVTLFDANTILKADSDDTPVALSVGASTLVGRGAAGGISALAPSAARIVLGLGSLATLSTITSTEITDGTIVNGDVSASAAIGLNKLAVDPLARANHTGTQLASTISNFDTQVRTSRLDQMAAPTASVALGGQTITGLGTPTNASDAATKAYADSVAAGLDVKASVRVASSSNVTLASPGATIDGVAMATNDRVLLMGQTTGSENGIWQYNGAAAAMTRTSDADTSAEVTSGMFTFVEEGTTNADRGFVLTTNAPITLGSTALTFTQFSGPGTVTGTTNRITVTGSQVDIAATYVGQSSLTTLGTITTGTWQGTAVAVANGGTGAATAAAAKINLGFVGRFTQTFGDGATQTYTLTHNLNTLDVVVELYEVATGNTVVADIKRASVNTIQISGFVTAPATNALRAVVLG